MTPEETELFRKYGYLHLPDTLGRAGDVYLMDMRVLHSPLSIRRESRA